MSTIIGPEAIKKSQLVVINESPSWGDYETIERKGMGHPDTISDTLASQVSKNYSNYSLKNCEGLILHHQIDKLMVIGGKTEVRFGYGKFVKPIRIVVAGRATYSYGNINIPVDNILKTTIKKYFAKYFPLVNFSTDVLIENLLTNYAGPGTTNQSKGAIANMFTPNKKTQVRGYEKLVANDTSFCLSYSPLSDLENSVLEVEGFINSPATKSKFPWLGSDVKIMAVRNKKDVSITMCIPQIAEYVNSLKEYKNNLVTISKVIEKLFKTYIPDHNLELSINTKDDYEKMNIYLTVSGASLSGDIGVVGRGNRTNGLITSNRPMSIEGTNGKNPRYYSGFIYAVACKNISSQIYNLSKMENSVEIVSQNGGPLKSPWRIRIVTLAKRDLVQKIVKENLKQIENITTDFVKGNIKNY